MNADRGDDLTPAEYADLAALGTGVARRVVGPRLARDPDFQSAIAEALWRAHRNYDPAKCPAYRAYVAQRVRYAVIDLIRHRLGRGGRRRAPHDTASLTELHEHHGYDPADPVDHYQRAVDALTLQQIMDAADLTPRMRDGLRRVLAGETHSDLARAWGASLSSVSHTLGRAVRRCQAVIAIDDQWREAA